MHWDHRVGGPVLSEESVEVICGIRSCRLDVPAGASTVEFGKVFPSILAVGPQMQFLDGKVLDTTWRVKLDIPAGSSGPTSKALLKAWAVDTATGAVFGGVQRSKLKMGASGFQQPHVSLVVPASSPSIEVRLALVLQNLPGTTAYIDQASFKFTSPEFGTPDPLGCDDPYRLVARDMIVEVSDATGNLASIIHRGSSVKDLGDDRVLTIDQGGSLVAGTFVQPGTSLVDDWSTGDRYGTGSSTSWSVDHITVGTLAGGDQLQHLRLTHDVDCDGDDLPDSSVSVTLEADPTLDGVNITTTLDNQSGGYVEALRSPVLRLLPDLAAAAQPGTPQGQGVEEPVDPPPPGPSDAFLPHENGGRIFVPMESGAVFGDEVAQLQLLREYPGVISMQLLSYFDQDVGLAVEARDPHGQPKRLGYRIERDDAPRHVELVVEQLNEWQVDADIAAGESYPVRLSATRGSWMDAADDYRDWARTQPWWVETNAAGRVAQTPAQLAGGLAPGEVLHGPQWLDERPHITCGTLRPMGVGQHKVPTPADWDDHVQAWEGAVGSTFITLHTGWERNGPQIGPYYTPFAPTGSPFHLAIPTDWDYRVPASAWYDAQQVEDVFASIAAVGHHPLIMVAGLKWQRSRPGLDRCSWWVTPFLDQGYGDPAVAEVIKTVGIFPTLIDTTAGGGDNDLGLVYPPAADVCVRTKDGQLLVKGAVASWDGVNHRIDSALPFATDLHRELARYAAERDVHIYLMDQLNGGGTEPCYATDHGHGVGFGEWMADTVADLLAEVRLAGRQEDGDFAVFMESPGELFIPVTDGFFMGANHLDGWPAAGVGDDTAVVPAFQYVYGQVAPTLSREVLVDIDAHPNEEQTRLADQRRLARVFASGTWLGFRPHDYQLVPGCGNVLEPLPSLVSNETLDQLQQLNALRPLLDPVFRHGQRITDAGMLVGNQVLTERVWIDDVLQDLDRIVPDVEHAAWEHAGQQYLVLANPTDVPVAVTRLPDVIGGAFVPDGTSVTLWDSWTGGSQPYAYNTATFYVLPREVRVISY